MKAIMSSPDVDYNTRNVAWYIADTDLAELNRKAQELFVNYSHLPPDNVKAHVQKIVSLLQDASASATYETRILQRDKAWEISPLPCIGQMRFLDFSLAMMPSYDEILVRLGDSAAPARLLDVGCCLAQDLRRLVADGAPSENLVGLDLEPRFLSLSYDLFADHEFYKGQMAAGDIFDQSVNGPVALLEGTIDIIHAASFFHLFDWDTQVKAGVQLVQLMKTAPDSLVLGRHLGSSTGEERFSPTNPSAKMYLHCPDSFKRLWVEISDRTSTKWDVNAWLKEVTTHSKIPDKKQWMNNRIQLLYFEVRRSFS
jgi:SAM-dependent methyltransferase